MDTAGPLHLGKLLAQPRHPVADHPPVGLDLGFAGAAEKAEAAALALKVRPTANQPPRLIIEMGEFDLKPPLGRCGPLPENLQNQSRAVDDLRTELGFEISLLDGTQRRIDDDKLDIVHGRDLPRVKVDKGQIETAVTNLCTNARDAMIEKNGGGHLTIRTSRADAAAARKDGFTLVTEGDYVMIEVIDDGAGIPPEIMEKIFQPFYTTKEPGKGTGLGLATVYGIVKQSNGFIYPVSRVGRGTTFKIFLPAWVEEAQPAGEAPVELVAPTPAVVAPAPKSGDLAGRGSILLVEDEDGVRGIAAQLLASCGYQVIEAGDGEKALEIIKEHSGTIDLLISDVVMPGMDGPALLKEARPWLTNTRVMFISDYAERDLAKTLEDDRAISFLPKPFTLKQLAERVKQELKDAA